MGYKFVFSRLEYKYLINKEAKNRMLSAIAEYMKPDMYGRSTLRNIYFDTSNYLLIRRSIEKPSYKEKLRIRSYTRANDNSNVFVELKKKYKGVVYKRRISMPYGEAMAWICNRSFNGKKTQMHKEIDYFLDYYGDIMPKAVISYEREAFFGKEDESLRITFDENILARTTDLSLDTEVYGELILEDGMSVMEIKCSGGMPLWLTRALSENDIYKGSFSKYGTAYRKLIFPSLDFKKGV